MVSGIQTCGRTNQHGYLPRDVLTAHAARQRTQFQRPGPGCAWWHVVGIYARAFKRIYVRNMATMYLWSHRAVKMKNNGAENTFSRLCGHLV